MPEPGEGDNLQHNLGVLAGLVSAGKGTKLAYDIARGRFSAQSGGKFQGIARTFSTAGSVTSRTHFADPILEIFSAARSEIRAGKLAQQALDDALGGLRQLRVTYAEEQTKLAALDAVIADVQMGLRPDAAPAVALRERYRGLIVYGFYQGMFLSPDNQGVCYSFVVDWARRLLVLNKKSFAHSKKAPYKPQLHLDTAQKQRMLRKVDGSIGVLQAELKTYNASAFGTTVMQIGRSSGNPKLQRYGDLRIDPLDARDKKIDERTSGSTVMNAVIEHARQAAGDRKSQYMFVLSVIKLDKSGGHAVGVRFGATSLHFFDPNLGEVYFATGPGRQSDRFFDDWWTSFYSNGDGTNTFRLWGLEAISRFVRPRRDSDEERKE